MTAANSRLRTFGRRLRGFADTMNGAAACAAAAEAGRQPSARALRAAGIDPKAYSEIGQI